MNRDDRATGDGTNVLSELSGWWDSPLGVLQCDTCAASWPCHLYAWGRVDTESACACGGIIHITLDGA